MEAPHDRNHLCQFRWIRNDHCCLLNLEVRQCKFDQLCNLRCDLRKYSRCCFLVCVQWMYDWAIGPSSYREKAMTLAKSVRSRLPLVFNALKVKKTKLRSAVSVVCLLRLWHLNRVWSVTFWVVVTDYFLLGQQTVLLLQSIGSTIWKLVFGSFSTCPNLLSLAILAAGVHTFVLEIGLCTMLRCDMETWPRSATGFLWIFSVLLVVRILCDSMVMFSWSCFEHEELNLFVSLTNHLHRVVSSLNRSGWLVTLQSIAEVHNVSKFLLAPFMIS